MLLLVDRFERFHTFKPKDASHFKFTASLALHPAQRVSYDNSQWSPRRTGLNHWLLRGLVRCGHCGVSVSCHKMRGRNGTFHYYYYCRNHDPLNAGGEQRRCPERNIRADELDAFVFEQVRAAMLHPDVLLTGEAAVSARRETGDDDLLIAQLARFDRKIALAVPSGGALQISTKRDLSNTMSFSVAARN